MTDIKISQLGSTTTLESADLIPVSKSLGGGNWESKSISGLNLLHGLTSTRLLTVNSNGTADASNIKDAVAIALSMSPTQDDIVAIQVYNGTYLEDNPIVIPPWVTISTVSGFYGVMVTAINDGNIFQSTGGGVVLNGLTIVGGTGFSNVGFLSTSFNPSLIQNCAIVDCEVGIWSNGGHINSTIIKGSSLTKSINKFLYASNGGYLSCTTGILGDNGNTSTYGLYSDGAGSEIYLFSGYISYATNGIYANNNGYIDSFSSHFDHCNNSIYIGSTGSSHIKAVGVVVEDSVTNDVLVESATARLA
jgi:hypothetical protein